MKKSIFILFSIACMFSCGRTTGRQEQPLQIRTVQVPLFNADSAFQFIQNQVDFGPRVPNTPAHLACAEYLANELRRFGARVIEQRTDLVAFDGTVLNAINIIGSFQPENRNRILLFAHWDSRPWADEDPNPENRHKPVLGANDGASGVGVLLEIARQISMQQPRVGIDIIFFDAEDWGAPQHLANENTRDSWALGSQYWSRNPHEPNYWAQFGILIDMVGAPNATFYREQFSDHFARNIVDKVWNQARRLGFEHYFVNRRGSSIIHDHFYVNRIIGIPSIVIIQRDASTPHGFGSFWHTINDTMENICTNTLHAVGTTVLHVIYNF